VNNRSNIINVCNLVINLVLIVKIHSMSKIVIKKLNNSEKKELGIDSWPIWEKEISRFNWTYSGDEQCYIIDGEFSVETDDGNYDIKPGDFVVFKKGLSCVWDIKKSVKKHYNFS